MRNVMDENNNVMVKKMFCMLDGTIQLANVEYLLFMYQAQLDTLHFNYI